MSPSVALHHPAGIHHRDLVGSTRDDAEVVGDQDHCHVAATLLVRQKIQNLGLYGNVECGGWFARDQELRFAG
jgi:hypothetical protein